MSDTTIAVLHRLGWALLGIGVFFEALNIVYSLSWLRKGRPQTHILILPALLNVTGIALLYGNRAFGLMAGAVAVHLLLVTAVPCLGRRYNFRTSGKPELE